MARPPDTPLRRPDLDPDPIAQFRGWFARAAAASPMPEAMTLCTADAQGRPAGRMVLLKGVSESGFDFFTNYESRKARELDENPRAALVLWWVELDRSVRIEGPVTRLGAAESDAYFHSRPRGARLGAIASPQSRPVPDRAHLEELVAAAAAGHPGEQVPRPGWWGGYRLEPEAIEFWQGRHERLHDRFRYERRARAPWDIARLAP